MAKIIIEVCAGTSCHLMGSYDVYQVLEKLKPQQRELLEVKMVSCLGQCGQGPSVRIQGKSYVQITPEELKKLVEKKVKEGE